jgi:hypothetical protein
MSLSSDICENVSGNSIEAILAMKRLHEEQDDGPEQKKRDVYNEHGVDINDETISNETITSESATSTSNETIIDSPDITTSTEGSTASSSSEPNVNQSGQVKTLLSQSYTVPNQLLWYDSFVNKKCSSYLMMKSWLCLPRHILSLEDP